ncbi:hypothetical protein [Pseudomonas sp. EA_65y_Pfl2_P74]|uniref:hypothetical protein n=1 Tax=Pseudomonas sp. EA_65y_Pfl2_P74 TaxID=3088694 RepID=UPI0030D7A018
MDFDPKDSALREQLLPDHPMVKKSFIAFTPSIEWAYQQIRDLIWLSAPSMYFNSVPRMGKTLCAKALVDVIRSEFPDRYVVLVTADVAGLEGIIKTIAMSIGLIMKARENLISIREKVLTHISCELSSINGSHFVLVVDEMQCLKIQDYLQLQVLQNRLSLAGVNMTNVGFAQTEINSVRSSLILGQNAAVVARFLSERVEFSGCQNSKWLAETLKGFDENLIYPSGSGCSYTNFFLPLAYSNGFRLNNFADLIFERAKYCIRNSVKPELPTAHLFAALGYMMIAVRVLDKSDFELTAPMIDAAISKSGMANFAKLME